VAISRPKKSERSGAFFKGGQAGRRSGRPSGRRISGDYSRSSDKRPRRVAPRSS
jgi:hypothetical protein